MQYLIIPLIIFAIIFLVPLYFSTIHDPLSKKRIQTYCNSLGLSNVEVKIYPGHYGVKFTKNGQKYYVKCSVGLSGNIAWKGKSPAEMLNS